MNSVLVEVNHEPIAMRQLCDNDLNLPYKIVSNFYNESKEKTFLEIKFLTKVTKNLVDLIQGESDLASLYRLLKKIRKLK